MLERIRDEISASPVAGATVTGTTFALTQPPDDGGAGGTGARVDAGDGSQLASGVREAGDGGLQAAPGRNRRRGEEGAEANGDGGGGDVGGDTQRKRSLLAVLGGERWASVERGRAMVPKASLDRVASYHWLGETQRQMGTSRSYVPVLRVSHVNTCLPHTPRSTVQYTCISHLHHPSHLRHTVLPGLRTRPTRLGVSWVCHCARRQPSASPRVRASHPQRTFP